MNLNKKEDFYQNILENLSDFIAVIDEQGKFTYATPSFYSVLGYKPEEVIGKVAFMFIHPDDLAKTKEDYAELKDNPGFLQNVNVRLLHRDGSFKYVKGTRKNLLNEPNVNGIVLNVTDITELIKSQEEIKRNENLLKIVEKITNVGGWEYNLVEDSLYWTEETYRIHEIEKETVTNNTSERIKQSILCYTPEYQKIIEEAFYKAIYEGVEYELECPFTTRKGKNIWVKTIGKPICERGKVIKVLGNIIDITETKVNELINKSRMNLIDFVETSTLDEFIQKFLDEAESLTQSKIAFFHFVNDDQETLQLQMWSTNTMQNMCKTNAKGLHDKISEAGVWVECVKQRKPIIHNDYQNMLNKQGLPDGHAPIIRELVVPLIRNNKIVTVLGVGNKDTLYDENDIKALSQLTDLSWDIIEKKRSTEILKTSEKKLQTMLDYTVNWEFWIKSDNSFAYMSPTCEQITEYTVDEFMKNPKLLYSIIHPDDQKIFFNHRNNFDECLEHALTFRIITKSNQIKWISHVCQEITEENGESIGRRVTHRDVTEELLNKEKLKELTEKEIFKNEELEKKNLELKKAREATLNIIDDLMLEMEEKRKAEHILIESEEKYRLLIENQGEGVGKVDENEVFVFTNPAADEIFGVESGSLIGRCIKEFVDEESFSFISNETEKRRQGLKNKYELKITTKENQEKWLLVTTSPIYDKQGNFESSFGVFRDITERKIAENLLKESEARIKSIFKTAPVGIGIVVDRIITEVNEFLLNLTGYCKEEIIGKNSRILYPYDEDYHYVGKEKYEQIRKKGIGILETRWKKKNGDILYIILSSSPIDINDYSKGVTFTAQDITERKLSENLLKASEEKYRNLFETMQNGFYRSTPEGYFVDANPAFIKMLEYENKEELLKVYIPNEIYVVPEDRDNLIRTSIKNLSQKQVYKLKTKKGNIIWVEDNARYIEDENGKTIFHEGICQDITERIEAEQALKESEEKFRMLVETAPEAIYVHIEEKFIYLNDAAVYLFGAESGYDLIGESIYDRIHSDYKPLVEERIRRLYEEQEHVEMIQQKYLKIDGEEFDVEVSAVPVVFNDKNGGLVFVRDLTDRVKAEKALMDSEERFRMLVDRAPDGIYVITDLKYVYANQEYLRIIGAQNLDDIRNKPILDNIHPEYIDAIVNRYHLILKDKINVETLVRKYIKLNGDEIHVEVSAGYINFNNTDSVLVFVRDLTEKLFIEKALVESEIKFKELVEEAPIGVYRTISNGIVLDMNNRMAKILGYKDKIEALEKMNETGISIYKTKQQREEILLELEKKIRIENYESEVVRTDGEIIWLSENARISEYNEDGNFIIEGFAIDITSKKEIEKALTSSEKRFRSILENMEMLSVTLDINANIVFTNEYLLNLTGYKKEEIMHKNWFGLFIDNKISHQIKSVFKNTISNNNYFAHYENEILSKNGEKIIVRWTNTVQKNSENEIVSITSIGEDITIKKQNEELIRWELDLSNSLSTQKNLKEIYKVCLLLASKITETEKGAFYRLNKNNDFELLESSGSVTNDFIAESKIILKDTHIYKQIIESTKVLLVPNVHSLPDSTLKSSCIQQKILSVYIIPLKNNNELIGFISLGSSEIAPYTEAKITLLTKMSSVLSQYLIKIEAEISLSESERKFKSLFNTMQEGTALFEIVDKKINCQEVNKSFEKMLDVNFEDLQKQNNLELLIWDNKKILNSIIQVAKNQKPFNFEYSNKRLDKDFEITVYSPEINKFAIILRDITEKKNNENRIKLLFAAVEQSQVSIVITDLYGDIEYVNPKFEEITGYQLHEVVGENPRILKSKEESNVDYKELWQTLSDGKEWRGIFKNRKKNGEVFYESAIISPMKDEINNISHFIAVKEDITEKVKIEEELNRHRMQLEELIKERTADLYVSEERFRTMSESSTDLIIRWDLNLNYIYINPIVGKYINRKKEEIIGSSIKTLHKDAAFLKPLENAIDIVFTTKNFYRLDVNIFNEVWIDLQIVPEFSKENEIISLLAYGRDISERKMLEESILKALNKEKELNEMKTKFVSMVSHEYRTPLTNILTSAELLEMFAGNWDGEKTMSFIKTIQNSVENLNAMLEEVLLLSKSESGKLTFKPSLYNLFNHCNDLINSAKLRDKNNINIDFEFLPKKQEFYFDSLLVNHILENLISNAIKYSRPSGNVSFFVEEESEFIKFTIVDEGLGISVEDQKKLFEPFHRASNVTNIKGTGLGLSIVKNCVEQHNGKIEFSSQIEQGTKFVVWIKVKEK